MILSLAWLELPAKHFEKGTRAQRQQTLESRGHCIYMCIYIYMYMYVYSHNDNNSTNTNNDTNDKNNGNSSRNNSNNYNNNSMYQEPSRLVTTGSSRNHAQRVQILDY